jgi:hypothetical protein
MMTKLWAWDWLPCRLLRSNLSGTSSIQVHLILMNLDAAKPSWANNVSCKTSAKIWVGITSNKQLTRKLSALQMKTQSTIDKIISFDFWRLAQLEFSEEKFFYKKKWDAIMIRRCQIAIGKVSCRLFHETRVRLKDKPGRQKKWREYVWAQAGHGSVCFFVIL